jgi:hypothetical protein
LHFHLATQQSLYNVFLFLTFFTSTHHWTRLFYNVHFLHPSQPHILFVPTTHDTWMDLKNSPTQMPKEQILKWGVCSYSQRRSLIFQATMWRNN